MDEQQLVSAEAVSVGHPDKIADQISDTVLDVILAADINAKVACETLVKSDLVVIAGEIATRQDLSKLDLEAAIRDTIRRIGYENTAGFNSRDCRIRQIMHRQSSEINHAVMAKGKAGNNRGTINRTINRTINQGAGDQGIVIGFACDDTPVLMPAASFYAHQLMRRQAQLRETKQVPWLMPDAKCLVEFRYLRGKPVAVNNILLSTQHRPGVAGKELQRVVIEEIIRPVIPSEYLRHNPSILVNSSQRFTVGGPIADCGMTGRKLMIDSYGSIVPHGGGAYSGKDPSKIDRSGALMARFIAKNLVAAKLAKKIMVQICYAIGVAEPISLDINTFSTGRVSKKRLLAIIDKNFDLRPAKIIEALDLLRPIYTNTAAYGHFGRSEPEFTWERLIDVQY